MNPHPIVATARELRPLIREHRPEGERQARLTREVVEACGQAGLFRMAAPREVGGLELPPSVVLAASEEVSKADPAVGWYIDNSVPACLAAASLTERERAELFADPNVNFGYSYAPVGRAVPDTGGYRVSGKWPLVTGVEDAKWAGLAGAVMDGDIPRQVDGSPDVRLFLIPTAGLTIFPTWQHAAAMRGTGSNAASVHDVFVPEAFAYTSAKPLVIDRLYFRTPPILIQFPAAAGVVLGVLHTALESTMDALGSQVSSVSGQTRRDQPHTQELIAGATAAVRAARAGFIETTDAVWELVSKGEEVPKKVRAEIYASGFHVVEVGRDIASRLYAGGTRDAFMRDHPLEQALRDLHAIAYGVEVVRFVQHSAGRVLLGGEHDHGI